AAMDESTHRARAVGFNAREKTRPVRRGFIMRERLTLQIIRHQAAALWRINGFQASRQRFGGMSSEQSQDLDSLQERFESFPQAGPKFNLTGDRAMAY